MARSSIDPDSDVRAPSVLVVLVVRDAGDWLRECLRSLAAQTYPRLAVIAVDDASTDGSREMLEQALGAGRVLTLVEPRGFAGSVRAALEVPAAREADYLLVLHDDTTLDPDAAARLIDAAIGIEGVERVGVVGPKVVDRDDPRLLREVGRSIDRFGHPLSPLQDGEIDQGQYDRVLEVLFVPTIAMLVSRECLERIGPPDERLASESDLDLCWRARLAGFRVLMTPLARARHVGATELGRRSRGEGHRQRYRVERAALAAMLTNYRPLTLAWLLPLYGLLGIARLAFLTLSGRFEDDYELLAAWGWNVMHLGGTYRSRRRAQKARVVPDRAIRRFTESAGFRLPRWFDTAGKIVAEQRELEEAEEGEPPTRRVRHQAMSLARSHPALVASLVGGICAAFAFRSLIGPEPLQGAAVTMFPAGPDGFFRELLSGYRTTWLGGSLAASPALGAMGGFSALLLSSTGVAQKVMLAGSVVLAAILAYRVVARQTRSPVAAVIASACYTLSALTMWAFSQGRIPVLVAIAMLPTIVDRLDAAFARDPPVEGGRWVVGLGLAVAFAAAFYPGVLPAIVVLVAVQVVGARSRGRGASLTLASVAVAALLLFPLLPSFAAAGGSSLTSRVGSPDLLLLARLVVGPAPGAGLFAWFLPLAASLAFAVVGTEYRGRAFRAFFAAVAGLALAFLSAAGYLPNGLANVPAYLAVSAFCEAELVGFGVASVLGVRGEAFGFRQFGAGALGAVLCAGLLVQALFAMVGGWAFGGAETGTPAWAVVQSEARGDFRVLWLGRDDGEPFVAPGGDPQGTVGPLRYGITDREGATALDTARATSGPGDAYARAALAEILSGTTRHGGALLAPLGIRYLAAQQGDLPAAASVQLERQLDLDRIPAVGLIIFGNAKALPEAGVVGPLPPGGEAAFGAPTLDRIQQLPHLDIAPLTPVEGGWNGVTGVPGKAVLSTEFSSSWHASGATSPTAPVFGWATAMSVPAGSVEIRFAGQWKRTAEIVVLAVVWAAAIWIMRRPAT